MMLTLWLLGAAAVIAAAASKILPAARWVYRAPRLGLAAWHTALVAIILSVTIAFGSLLWRWPGGVDTVCAWWAWCQDALSGTMGQAAQLLGWLIAATIVVLAARAATSLARTWRACTASTREHQHMLRLIARHDPALGALVVDHPQPAAYALPDGTIVTTTGTLQQLPPAQVDAVLAHERAHATGRHHLMMRIARALHETFPSVAAFADAHHQIDRLVELCADDTAARAHARLDLARALVACAQAATNPASAPAAVPVDAAAAHGGNALERVHRLLDPPPPLTIQTRTVVALGLIGTLALPLSIVAIGYLFPALAACMPTS